jgi:hypothetical protein
MALGTKKLRQILLFLQGSEGNELLYYYGVLTDSLVPPHRYVPHILIDGVHTEELQVLIS